MNYKNKLLLEFNLRNKLVEKAEYQRNIIQKISNIISTIYFNLLHSKLLY